MTTATLTLPTSGTRKRRIALVGSPNSGKTTLFNALTGLRRKVGNYPGVTVDHVEGELAGTPRVRLIDLPGIYALEPMSPDEAVTRDVLRGQIRGVEPPDAALVIADAQTLARSLALVASVLELRLPTALVITMIDELAVRRGGVDADRLAQRLGIPVLGVVGSRGIGLDDLRALLADPDSWNPPPTTFPWQQRDHAPPAPLALGGADLALDDAAQQQQPRADRLTAPLRVEDDGQLRLLDGLEDDAMLARYAWGDEVYRDCVTEPPPAVSRTDRIDRVLLHPVWGLAAFAVTMFAFFQIIFAVAAPLQEALEAAVTACGELARGNLGGGLAESLVVDGIIAGVGAVLVFVPQIALLLLMIQLLEGIGYLSRAAFLVDRVMGWAGLEGRCFVALLSSYACAVPGIMAARTVPDPRSRLATILVAPFMTCSARLPVYGLLIGAFVPATTVAGFIGLQGLTLFGLYLLGSLSALLAAALLKRGVLRGAALPFYMELPPYRVPRPSVIASQVWRGVKMFARKAGTIILAASVALWLLLSFPAPEPPDDIADDEAAARAWQLEQSYAADIGRAIEPAIEPLGFDWKIGIGLIASLAAREVIVSTLGQIYAFGGEEDDLDGLGDRLRAEANPTTGAPAYSLATALSLLVFFVYSLQCISTLAVMRRETNSLRWPLFAFGCMLAVAWAASFLTFQLAS